MAKFNIEELTKVFKKQDINEFKKYLRKNGIKKIKELNDSCKDILIFAISCGASLDVLKFIIKHCQYETLNYDMYSFFQDGHNYTPLTMAIKQENFKVADYLVNKNVKTYPYVFIVDNKIKKRYIVKSNMPLNSFERMVLIWNFIKNNDNDLLELAFKKFIFDNSFILHFLELYKQKRPLSDEEIRKTITESENKISFDKSMYEKMIIENKNYEGFKILSRNDYRDKDIIRRDIFQIFNVDSLKNEREKFVEVVNNQNFDFLFDEYYFDTLKNIEEKVDIITNYIKSNNKNELKNYIQKNKISLKYFNKQYNDMLILSIDNQASFEIVQYILQECQYDTLNYCIKEDTKSPLLLTLSTNQLKIADLFIKHQADINSKIKKETILNILLNQNLLNKKNFKFLLHKNIDISSHLINKLIETKQNDLLNLVFKYYPYNNYFILNLLKIYEKKTPLTNQQLNKMIDDEQNKIKIDDIYIGIAINKENYEGISIIYKNDPRKDIILKNMIKDFNNMSSPCFNNFSHLIESKTLNLPLDEFFLQNLAKIEIHAQAIMDLICDNNSVQLKKYIHENLNAFPLTFFNIIDVDLLIYAIENNSTIDIIDYLIHFYPSLNYTFIDRRYRRKSPLLEALSTNNFEVASFLIKNGADIHYIISHSKTYITIDDIKIYSTKDAFYYLYQEKHLNTKNLQYLLNHVHHINSDLLNEFIKNNQNELLENIFKFYIFDNYFIIKLLSLYRNKTALSDKQLKSIIKHEKGKIKFPIYFYKTILYNVFNFNLAYNYDAINILFDYETCDPDEFMEKVFRSNIIWNSIKDNNTSLLEKVLNHELFDIRKYNFRYIMSEIMHYVDKIEIFMLLIRKVFSCENITDIYNIIETIILAVIEFEMKFVKQKMIIELVKTILEKLLNLPSFNFKVISFDKLLQLVVKTNNNEIVKYFVDHALKHESFDFNSIKVSKSLLLINSTYDKSDNNNGTLEILQLFVDKLFEDSTFNIQNKIYKMLVATVYINDDGFTNYFLEKLLTIPNEKLFDFRKVNYFKKIISILNQYNNDIVSLGAFRKAIVYNKTLNRKREAVKMFLIQLKWFKKFH